MNKNQTYRLAAAFFFAALVSQVFILQGLHHLFGHEHHDSCEVEGVHLYADGHSHFSCDICFFHFAPSEVYNCELSISQPEVTRNKLQYGGQSGHFIQRFLRIYLRGPPFFTA